MSSSSYSYPIRDLLTNSETPLGKLIAQANAIDHLNQTFQEMLDPTLIPHCRIGTYENGILLLIAESAAYATRLRYHIPIILSTLRNFSQWAGIRSIQIKIKSATPERSKETVLNNPPTTLSTHNISNIKELVDSLKKIPGNQALIASLERLIKV
jgi:hypothetical protein